MFLSLSPLSLPQKHKGAYLPLTEGGSAPEYFC